MTSGTIFASRKLAFVDLLGAICLFVNASKGLSAVQLSRDLDVQHKTAFVLMHKLREAMTAETREAHLAARTRSMAPRSEATSDQQTCACSGSTGGDWPIAAASAAWWSSCGSAAVGH